MEKNRNGNKIQGNGFVKGAVTLDQRQVPYFDFKQKLTKTEGLQSLLHPANDKYDDAKAKNKQKANTPTAAQKPVMKRMKDEMDARK